MQTNESRLTVFFEDPFWVGVYERLSEGKLEACKITFGAEPRDCEIYGFFLDNFRRLSFSPPVEAAEQEKSRINPKRMQREINRRLEQNGVGTKSQQALKMQQEALKTERKESSKQRREQEEQYRFELRQKKRKEKHRGH